MLMEGHVTIMQHVVLQILMRKGASLIGAAEATMALDLCADSCGESRRRLGSCP
jgi:hypothetical protein